MAAQKRLERLLGNTFSAPNGDMRMKGFEIRFETRTKDRILNAPMQRKEMRMPLPHTRPGHRWPAARVEDTDAAQGQKKRRHRAPAAPSCNSTEVRGQRRVVSTGAPARIARPIRGEKTFSPASRQPCLLLRLLSPSATRVPLESRGRLTTWSRSGA